MNLLLKPIAALDLVAVVLSVTPLLPQARITDAPVKPTGIITSTPSQVRVRHPQLVKVW